MHHRRSLQCTVRGAAGLLEYLNPAASGGAIAALQLGKRPETVGKTILAIVPSFAERYLSTALFEGI